MKSIKEPTEMAKLSLQKQREEVNKLHGSATKLVGVYKTELHPELQITAEMVGQLAAKMQALTGVSDEAVQGGENMLLTFTNIGKNVFPEATQTMLDMSVALGQDVTGSAMQLGKALNDPILGVTALRRVGVQFNDSQQETIKKLVESGHLLDAQKMILKELQVEFGGSAKAAGQTFAGQLNILNGAINDVQESIGKKLAEVLTPFVKNMTEVVTPIAQAAAGTISWSDAANSLATNAGTLGTNLAGIITFVQQHNEVMPIAAGILGGVLLISILAATAAMASFIGLSLPVLGIAAGIGAVGALIITNWGQVGPVLMPVIETIRGFFATIFEGIMSFVTSNMPVFQAIWAVFVNIIDYGMKYLSGLWNAVWPSMLQVLTGIWTAMTGGLRVLWGAFQLILSVGLGLLTGDWKKAWEMMKNGLQDIFGGLQTWIKGWWDAIVGFFKGGLNSIIGSLNGFINVINKAGGGKVSIGSIPSFDTGGPVENTGLAMVHAGEFVLSRDMLSGRTPVPSNVNTTNYEQPISINFYGNNPGDLDSIGYRLAWELRNSR